MIHAESAEQQAYFDWAGLHPQAHAAFAIPNGGRRSKIEAARLKREGVRAGVPDVFLPKVRGGASGLWLEFKSDAGRVSPSQTQRIDALVADGYAVGIVYGCEQAIALTRAYLSGRIGPVLIVLRRVNDLDAFGG